MIIISKPHELETIGTAVSSGCIRMLNEDVIDHV
jgi:lipoprotein-anchoring transpeptidase ErfK/SrfK